MYFYESDGEWGVNSVKYQRIIMNRNNSTKSFLQCKISVARFSSIYYSSIIIPAVGMRNH